MVIAMPLIIESENKETGMYVVGRHTQKSIPEIFTHITKKKYALCWKFSISFQCHSVSCCHATLKSVLPLDHLTE